jgi:hypothetical protein
MPIALGLIPNRMAFLSHDSTAACRSSGREKIAAKSTASPASPGE